MRIQTIAEYKRQGYSTDQLAEIREGLEHGIDVSVYADKEYFIKSDSFSVRYGAEPERYADKNAVYAAIAERYPVVYRLEPNGNRRTSRWIVQNIVDCLNYLCSDVTCGGSTITVYKLK